MNNFIKKMKNKILNDTNIVSTIMSIPFYLFRIFKVKQNKVIFINYNGKGYGDNGKYIAEELLKKDKYELYWALNKKNYKNVLPEGVKPIRIESLSFIYHLCTAKVWINNSRFNQYVRKRKKQFYIQTWHSSLRLKKIEKDAEKYLSKSYIKSCINDSKMIDLIVSGCRFSTNIYHNSFWYNGKIEECGTPRCDIFFNNKMKMEFKDKIFKKYNINDSKKIILYAPTFRNYEDEGKSYIDLDEFSKLIGNEYQILVRFHPISKYKIKNASTNIIDVTNYDNMQELLCVSDFLITDYSGCCFDMMINNKPCILFTKDLEEYLSKERDLYFDIKKLPFYNTNSESELATTINNFDFEKYKKRIELFEKEIGNCETGHAAEIIGNIIEKETDK